MQGVEPQWQLTVRRPRRQHLLAFFAGTAIALVVLVIEPGGEGRGEALLTAIGPNGQKLISGLIAACALWALIQAIAPGAAIKVAPEGVWISGSAVGMRGKAEFLLSEDVADFDVQLRQAPQLGIYRWLPPPSPTPFVRVLLRTGRVIAVHCYSPAEGEQFAAAALRVIAADHRA